MNDLLYKLSSIEVYLTSLKINVENLIKETNPEKTDLLKTFNEWQNSFQEILKEIAKIKRELEYE